jgi:hypothetical protein
MNVLNVEMKNLSLKVVAGFVLAVVGRLAVYKFKYY